MNQPDEDTKEPCPDKDDEVVDEASKDSFPASNPPAWTSSHAGGSAKGGGHDSMPPDAHVPPLKVGALYRASRRSWPERGQYMLREDGHELALFFASPSGREADVVSRGEVELGVLVRGAVIFFLYRFGSAGEIDWSDAPFSIHRVPREERVDPGVTGEVRRLTVVLVDASTGLVRALRRMSLSPAFSGALHAALVAQARSPYDPAEYGADLSGSYDRFAHSRQMAARSQRTAPSA